MLLPLDFILLTHETEESKQSDRNNSYTKTSPNSKEKKTLFPYLEAILLFGGTKSYRLNVEGTCL